MIKEVYVLKNGDGKYFARSGWRPEFSANTEDAVQYDNYDAVCKLLREGRNSSGGYSNWFNNGFYQIEKWFVATADE